MDAQHEYFVIEKSEESLPIYWDQESGAIGTGSPVTLKEPLRFRWEAGFSDTPLLLDYQECEQPLLSPDFGELLADLNLYGIQLLPALLSHPDKLDKIYALTYLHVWNRIFCIDKNQSELDLYDDGEIFGIDHLVLDDTILDKIDLNQRMIFELGEKISVLLIHEKLKKSLEAFHPTGIQFYPVTEWNSDVSFD